MKRTISPDRASRPFPEHRSIRALGASGALVVALGLLVVMAPAASASGTENSTVWRQGHLATTVVKNSTTAGYLSTISGQTSVFGTVVVPTFTCTGDELFDISVQLEAFANSTNIPVVGFVLINCTSAGAAPTLDTAACAGSDCVQTVPVAAGDKVSMSDAFSATSSTATLSDDTTKMSETETGPGATSATNSNFVVQRGSATIPTFTSIGFSGCTVDGTTLASTNPLKTNMTAANGATQVSTKAINGKGAGFQARFKQS